MKVLVYGITASILMSSMSAVSAAEKTCKGENYRATPPVPNNPTHIRNVVWRNTEFLRQAYSREQTSQSTGK